MQFDLISWGIGIPTGLVVNWLSIWLYNLWRKRQMTGDYFTMTQSKERIEFEGNVRSFEGNVRSEVIVKEMFRKLLEPPKDETQNDDKSIGNGLSAEDSAK